MLLPVTCSCLTMTWAMAVTCSAPLELQRTQREGATTVHDTGQEPSANHWKNA